MSGTETGRASVEAAFEHITYLLDRELAPAYRVRAFLTAAEVVGELSDAELDQRVTGETLTDLEHIGDKTAAVIAEAYRGETPAYLAELDATPLDPGEGAALRAALKGDCHSHSTWSDGGAPIATMAKTAVGLGHEYLVMTDHSPRLTIAHGLNRERLLAQLDEIAELNAELAPFRILTGIEVDIFEDGSLDQAEDLLARLDVVVASVHSKLRLSEQQMTQRMVLAVASPHVDILGHCTNRKVVGKGRPPSVFDADIVFAACARFDTAVEINCRPERQDPPDDLLDLALEWGCKVAIDTDAHAPGQLEWQAYGCEKAARHGIEPDDVVNTLPADALLAWTAAHPTD
ncbi:MAG TPA: PHP domain-containing protein [Acidimicrobiales bacterium]